MLKRNKLALLGLFCIFASRSLVDGKITEDGSSPMSLSQKPSDNIVKLDTVKSQPDDDEEDDEESSSSEEEDEIIGVAKLKGASVSTSRTPKRLSKNGKALVARQVQEGSDDDRSVYLGLQNDKSDGKPAAGPKGNKPGGRSGRKPGKGNHTGPNGIHGTNAAASGGGADGDGHFGSSEDNVIGGGFGGGGRPEKNPYKVHRAKPSEKVDPQGLAFFQHRKLTSLGWLWLTKNNKLGARDMFSLDAILDEEEYKRDDEYDWEFRRYDRACLFREYTHNRAKMQVPPIHEETKRMVEVQNEKLARRFLSWQFINQETPEQIAFGSADPKDTSHPLYNTYHFLKGTVDLFMEKICKKNTGYVQAVGQNVPYFAIQDAGKAGVGGGSGVSAPQTPAGPQPAGAAGAAGGSGVDTDRFLPEQFVNNVFNLFLVLRNMTHPKVMDDYASKQDDELIFKEMLQKCSDSEEDILWYRHSCGDQVLSSDTPNNYACTPFPKYDFNVKYTDPILDAVWHMFNAVHAFCFNQFMGNPRFWHKYSLIMTNAFTVQMRQRWMASLPDSKFYTRLLGPEYREHFNTINRCTYAAVLNSEVPMMLPRFESLSGVTFGKENFRDDSANAGAGNPPGEPGVAPAPPPA